MATGIRYRQHTFLEIVIKSENWNILWQGTSEQRQGQNDGED